MFRSALFTVAMLAASTPGAVRNAAAREIVDNLDVTTFPSSIGPRRISHHTTFADYGFDDVTYRPDGATLIWNHQHWSMSFRIVSDRLRHADICLHDEALPGPGGAFDGSYHAVSALRVDKTGRGRWTATPIPAGLPGCVNAPPLRTEMNDHAAPARRRRDDARG